MHDIQLDWQTIQFKPAGFEWFANKNHLALWITCEGKKILAHPAKNKEVDNALKALSTPEEKMALCKKKLTSGEWTVKAASTKDEAGNATTAFCLMNKGSQTFAF